VRRRRTFLSLLRTAIIAHRWVVESKLFLKFEAVKHNLGVGGVGGVGNILDRLSTIVLIKINLSRSLRKCLQGTPSLWEIRYRRMVPVHLTIKRCALMGRSRTRNAVERQTGSHSIGFRNRWTFLRNVRRQAIDTALWKALAALLARVRISVAVVVEFGSTVEVFEDEGIGLATHCAWQKSVVSAQPATCLAKAVAQLSPPKVLGSLNSPRQNSRDGAPW
jgi:hypothetical protein